MNATERLVETYYRQKGFFTATDIKVENGNNRQFDLLAFDSNNKKYYHIEISVTHSLGWVRKLSNISDEIKFKFFGVPKNKRPGNLKTDFAKGKKYLDQINNAYRKFGINPDDVIRVWCTWTLCESDLADLLTWKESTAKEYGLQPNHFEVLLFRDEVLKTLLENIGTSNYDDELLRTLSLVNQHRVQTNANSM